MQGNLTFIFGSENVSQDFPSNGVYDIQFANDWNNITSITQIADINTTTLQPVTLQTIPRPTPSPTPVATPQPSPIPTATPTPTLTPTPPQTSPSSTPTQKHHNGNPTQTADVVFIVSVGGVMSVTALFYVNVKGKKPRLPRTK
jgi:cell division septation protein DedD